MSCTNSFSDPSVDSWDLYVNQGADFNQLFIWQNPDGTPVNTTGYAAEMQVRQTPQDDTVLLTLSTGNGGMTLGGSNGHVNIIIARAVTAALATGEYVYDIKMTNPDTTEFFWLKGNFFMIPTVTR